MNEESKELSDDENREEIEAQRLERLKALEKQMKSKVDIKSEEMIQRKKLFFKSIKNRNWKFLSAIAIIGAIFIAYYIYAFSYHKSEMKRVRHFNDIYPTMLERFSTVILAYAFIRERIINNNSLSTFEHDFDRLYTQPFDDDELEMRNA